MNLYEGGQAKIMHDTTFVDKDTGEVKHQSLTEEGWRKIGSNTKKRRKPKLLAQKPRNGFGFSIDKFANLDPT